MVERGHDVTVFCRRSHYDDHAQSHLGMRLVHMPAIQQKHLETLSHTFLSSLRLPPEAAIICMGVGNAPVVRALELRGRQTVFNVDGADWRRDKWGKLAAWYLRTSERIAASSRSLIVADAVAVQRYYNEEFGRDTELVAYGADPPADRGCDHLARFGVTPERYLLLVGRLVPENGAHDYLAGAALAEAPMPAVVVGDAPYAAEYKAALRSAAPATTVFTGYQFGEAYQQFSANAWAFVLAATVGGTHPVLVEQMAAGNCILARDTESNREVLGDAGIYWSTPAELAVQIRRICGDEDLRRRLGAAAAKRAGEMYSWEQVTDRYLELCTRTLEARRRRSSPNP